MASTVDEINDVLSDEVAVNIDRMRECASRGLPDELRAEVWLYLLDVIPANKASVHSRRRTVQAEYEEIAETCKTCESAFAKRIAFDVQRLRPRDKFFAEPDVIRRIKNVLTAYTNQHAVDYEPVFAQLIAPLASVIESEADLYAAYCRTMQLIAELEPLNSRSSTCQTLFRSYLPELHQHFEDEEICFDTCMTPWLKGMLAAEIPIDAAVMLWDTYLSKGFFIHLFVCISIITQLREELEDLEQQEIMSYMKSVNLGDVEQVLVNAENLYSSSKNIL